MDEAHNRLLFSGSEGSRGFGRKLESRMTADVEIGIGIGIDGQHESAWNVGG
jgi:hypothetical protein